MSAEFQMTAIGELRRLVKEVQGPLVVEVGLVRGKASELAQPLLAAVTQHAGGRVRLCKVDAEATSEEFCRHFEVNRVPTILVFFQGELVGRFTHKTAPEELLARIEECSSEKAAAEREGSPSRASPANAEARQHPILLELDVSTRHERDAWSTLDFRVKNESGRPLRSLEVTVTSRVFATAREVIERLDPGEARTLEMDIMPTTAAHRARVTVALRGSDLCQHLSSLQGRFRIEAARPGVAGNSIASQVHIDARNVVFDSINAGGSAGSATPQQRQAGPIWEAVPLELVRVPFPAELERKYDEFVSRFGGETCFESQRQGSFSGCNPKDNWQSRSFEKEAEHQICDFRAAPDGVYRLELFQRADGKYLALAYEKRGATFVSHWRTNDREYARHHSNVFQQVE